VVAKDALSNPSSKSAKACKSKWQWVCAFYHKLQCIWNWPDLGKLSWLKKLHTTTIHLMNTSGFAWDPVWGANIDLRSELVWNDYVLASALFNITL
jgi:hypothetical protein